LSYYATERLHVKPVVFLAIAIAQGIALLGFVILGVVAAKRFREHSAGAIG